MYDKYIHIFKEKMKKKKHLPCPDYQKVSFWYSMFVNRSTIHIIFDDLHGLPRWQYTKKRWCMGVCNFSITKLFRAVIFAGLTFVIIFHFWAHANLLMKNLSFNTEITLIRYGFVRPDVIWHGFQSILISVLNLSI